MTPRPPQVDKDGRFQLIASMQSLMENMGGMQDTDFRDGFLHLVSVAAQNEDLIAVELVGNAVGEAKGRKGALPDEICTSIQALLVEAMGFGKEWALRQMCLTLDPHGEFIDVPKDWIGKGPG